MENFTTPQRRTQSFPHSNRMTTTTGNLYFWKRVTEGSFQNEYNYELEGKSQETKSYLTLLIDSKVEFDYAGLCICKDWDSLLSVVISCIINHKAPFSPLFYNLEGEFVFYFHHTGSIGLLYKAENDTVREILHNAEKTGY